MTLREYKRKRNFRRTPEPGPKLRKAQGWSYAVQKHAASHLHYDFRLELDGVLMSWAVPKGPSLDPAVKRLAMHVEDHPVEYGDFEGIIPEGEYGGGTVMLWDRGTWEPVGDPHKAYRRGKLKFALDGTKLRGSWNLIRKSRAGEGRENEWLLFKDQDEAAHASDETDVVRDQPLSVVSGRDLEEIAAAADNVWNSDRSSRRSPKRAHLKKTVRRKKPVKVPTNLKGAKQIENAINDIEHFAGNGPEVFRRASELGLEGIISKLRDRPYTAGRSIDWLKVKASHREEFVIGGFTKPGTRGGFGALLLGYYNERHELIYAGKVGTGFSDALLKELRARLNAAAQEESPFANLRGATGVARDAHWVTPQLVAQVSFTEWTRGGHLRHPSFLGLREDKPVSSVVRETAIQPRKRAMGGKQASKASATKGLPTFVPTNARATEGTLAGLRMTHPDKVLFDDGAITKLELAQYYLSIARWILPHVKNRPLSLVRCPEGAGKECFFQKHPGVGTPKSLRHVPVKEKNTTRNYLVVDRVEDLVSLAQIGALEIHVWGSQADTLERPDRMIFDLDPDPSVKWPRVVESAHQMKAFLDEIGLQSFVKTTGGKGLHIVVPLQKRHEWDEVKGFSKAVAEFIERADPRRYTSNMSKAQRGGKIFIDYLRNGRSATAIAAYSTRARPRATVSVPLSWAELTPDIHSDTFTIRNLPDRLNRLKKDPWAKINAVRQSITRRLKKQLGVSDA